MKTPNKTHQNEPMYGWALKPDGKPVPISAAKRGEKYICPVCRGDVVAKRGDVKQHHFAHVTLLQCTPDNVARAAAGAWIANELHRHLAESKPVEINWRMQESKAPYKLNLLKDIAKVEQETVKPMEVGNVVLRDAAHKPKVIILTGIEEQPTDPKTIATWTKNGVTVINLNPAGVRSGQMNLIQLLEQPRIMGGWWLLDDALLPENLVMDPDTIRKLFVAAAMKSPGYFYGKLEEDGAMTHLLQLGQYKVWLPPDYWRDVIGGSKNPLEPNIHVIIQEWQQEDGGKVELFYITVNDHQAVAIRHYAQSDQVRIKLGTAQFRLLRLTALDLARQFAGEPLHLPK